MKLTERICSPKQLYSVVKKYWYVAVPIHFILSAGFFGASFVVTKHVDVINLLRRSGVKEEYLEKMQGSERGTAGANFAMAFLLYKILMPVRYLCTMIGTKVMVKHVLGYPEVLKVVKRPDGNR